jgi:2-aminoadipate transaminase
MAGEFVMKPVFSDRISGVPRSFIREILKVTSDREIISFAGGLPNKNLFPVRELQEATQKVFKDFGTEVLQYGNSEGYLELRKLISKRYREKKNLDIPVEHILITNGSQQGLDLMGKILLNEGDDLVIEEPGYLGAIQAFSIFRPRFNPVTLHEDGIDIDQLKSVFVSKKPKLMYTVPNFQNPSGSTYSEQNRKNTADILAGTGTLLIEDDPYGDLRYIGNPKTSFKTLIPDNTILLGSFSKTAVPGFRLGWIVAPESIMDKLIIAKQAADLHSSPFTQCILYQYWKDNDIDAHIRKITNVYGKQRMAMINSIHRHFPQEVEYTRPEGGMFLWAALSGNLSSRDLLDIAMKDKVIFVPGDPFYVNRSIAPTMRLNFSCVDEETIELGIGKLGSAIKQLIKSRK